MVSGGGICGQLGALTGARAGRWKMRNMSKLLPSFIRNRLMIFGLIASLTIHMFPPPFLPAIIQDPGMPSRLGTGCPSYEICLSGLPQSAQTGSISYIYFSISLCFVSPGHLPFLLWWISLQKRQWISRWTRPNLQDDDLLTFGQDMTVCPCC